MKVGYARVSTDGQSVETQLSLLQQIGCERLFHETASGAKTARVQLRRCLLALNSGDVLYVTRLDRLARSTRDLLNILAEIVGRGAAFKSLGDTWADTTTPHGRLMLTILGGLAEFERELIKTRTSEGRANSVGDPLKTEVCDQPFKQVPRIVFPHSLQYTLGSKRFPNIINERK